ncbi:MAG: hypothetical protein LC734_05960 [Acidobacteria bacterium]|nr:hypothetical protein [Acidobacteriota bacterium]
MSQTFCPNSFLYAMNMVLEEEQEDLLSTLVEAYRNVPRAQRHPFVVVFADEIVNGFIHHRGLKDTNFSAYPGDLETLARAGLITTRSISGSNFEFDIHPEGFAYYRHMKERVPGPLHRVEAHIRLAGGYAPACRSRFRQKEYGSSPQICY